MAKVALLECDNCQEQTFRKEEPHFRVRGVNKADGKVGVLDLCVGCASELFGDKVKDARPRKAKAAPAPAKPAPAKTAQAKAS